MKAIKNFFDNNLIRIYIGFLILCIVTVIVTMILSTNPKTTEHTEVVAVVTHMDYSSEYHQGDTYKLSFSTYSNTSKILANGVIEITPDQYSRYKINDVIMVDIIETTNYFNEVDIEYQLIDE